MIAVIAGTGIEKLGSWGKGKECNVVTRHGHSTLYEVKVGGKSVCFLPRHSIDHTTAPHLINHKANIAALKKVGVKHIIGICSVGSLRVDIAPGSFVLLRDFINAAGGCVDSFFDEHSSPIIHTDMSKPYCPNERRIIEQEFNRQEINYVGSGTYVGVLGPRYETPAEIRAFRAWGGDVVGMTNIPECILAREAGICYAAIAIVTNLGTGLDDVEVEHSEVTKAAESALPVVERILHAIVPQFENLPDCSCQAKANDII